MSRPLLLLLVSISLSSAQVDGNSLSAFSNGEGVQGEVSAAAVQPDGKLVIGGQFTSVNGRAVSNIARLNPDGTLDQSFSPTTESGTNGPIYALALQADGKVVVGGLFSQAGSLGDTNLARFNADGSVDQSFGGENPEMGTNASVLAMVVRPDGKVVIGGTFSIVRGQPRRGIAQLASDGTLDSLSLPETSLSGTVKSIICLPNSGIIAAGVFNIKGQQASSLVKIAE